MNISVAKRLNFAAFLLFVAAVVVFVALPFYSDRAQARDEKQQAAIARVEQKHQTQIFLHKFDCTYGQSLKTLLDEAARSWGQQSQVALASWRVARNSGDEDRAAVAKKSYENAKRTAATYALQRADIPRLDGPEPCPTTP